MFERKILKIFGAKIDDLTQKWLILKSDEIYHLYKDSDILDKVNKEDSDVLDTSYEPQKGRKSSNVLRKLQERRDHQGIFGSDFKTIWKTTLVYCMYVGLCIVFCPKAGPFLIKYHQGSTITGVLDKMKE